MLPADRTTPQQITDALNQLLTDPTFRAASTRLQHELRQQSSIDTVIQALEDHATTRP